VLLTLDIGLLQINEDTFDGYQSKGLTEIEYYLELVDPHKNVDMAYLIWGRQGYGAWSAYNNGSYKKFVK